MDTKFNKISEWIQSGNMRGICDLSNDKKRGGPGRGQGRKPVAQGKITVTVSLRMTKTQRAKFALLGGAKWVRTQIDRADEQKESQSGSTNSHE